MGDEGEGYVCLCIKLVMIVFFALFRTMVVQLVN